MWPEYCLYIMGHLGESDGRVNVSLVVDWTIYCASNNSLYCQMTTSIPLERWTGDEAVYLFAACHMLSRVHFKVALTDRYS